MTTMSPNEAVGALKAAGWPKALWPVMVAIGEAESNLRVDDVGGPNHDGTYDYGWLQINSIHGYDKAKLLSDPVFTAKAGLSIWHGQGLRAWTTYNTGAYAKYLPTGQSAAGSPTAPPGASSSSSGGGILGTIGDVVSTATLGPLGFLLDGHGNPITDTGHALSSLASTVLHAAAWIGNPHNWLRVVEVIGGAAGVLLALHMLAESGVGGPVGAVAGAANKTAQHVTKAGEHVAAAAALA